MQNITDAAVGASALSRIRAIQSAAAGEDAAKQRMRVLWNVCFWSAVFIGGFAAVHLAVIGILRGLKKSTPKMLHLPRLEVLLFMMILPMIVAAGASLLRGPGASYIVAGVFFAVVLPVAFLGISLAFVIHYLIHHSVERRRAVFVLQLLSGTADQEGGDALQQQPRRPEMLLARDSGSSLTEQFLSRTESTQSSTRPVLTGAGAGSTTQFIVDRQASIGSSISPAGSEAEHAAMTARAGDNSSGADQATNADGSSTGAGTSSGTRVMRAIGRPWNTFQRVFMRPVFGFDFSGADGQQQSSASIPVGTAAEGSSMAGHGAWLCKGKHDTAFVKRYGCLFEDARGPQVYHIVSVYEEAAADRDENDPHAGFGVLVPASCTWSDTARQTLQTFGILCSATKMVLFALIINSVGSVNSIPQIMALVLVALLHLVYLRLCLPFRMRIELAAEMVASLCDLAVFMCGIILITKPTWTPEERNTMGLAMLIIQATGFLIFITVRLVLAGRTLLLTVGPFAAGLLRGRRRRTGARA